MNMKQVISFVFAGVLGGLVVLGGLFFTKNTLKTVETNYAQPVHNKINVKPKPLMAPFDFKVAAQKTMPAVVHISAMDTRPKANNNNDPFSLFFGGDMFNGPREGKGSGVIISRDGYIVTNNHVVANANKVSVTMYNNQKYTAEVIGKDKNSDLAVLKIDANNLPAIVYGDSDQAEVGEWVLAVGNPFDLTSTVTAGIISAKSRDININNNALAIEAFIQTDAAVNPGNSGGALVDIDGKLIGINTAIATRTGTFEGYSFAIPVNMMNKIVNDIIQFGSYQRGFLGINISDLDDEYADELGLNISQGVVVMDLVDGGAAQFAGVIPRDVITKVDGKTVKSAPELQEIVGRVKVGETIQLTINRKGKIQTIPVVLKAG